MKTNRGHPQHGVVLLAMLAVIMLAATWLLVSQLNAGSGGVEVARKNRNVEVLLKAKQALIGYVAAQAVKTGEQNPGALPCPENPGDFDSTTGRQGLVGTSCGTTTVGRFPWRTLGLDQLVDASGEPLWYVVSTGWGVASTSSNTSINSNSAGQLTIDGVANDAIALIIAPGPAFTVAASTSPVCAARTQTRPTTGNPDWRNYLECENATYPTADATFVTTGPSASFNDQVIKITVADIMPAIEAGIASRIEREIAPLITAVYSANASWGNLATLLPLGISFSIPTTNLNAYAGTPATQGLLPLSYAETSARSGIACTPSTTAPNYCEPNFVKWSGTPSVSISGVGVTPYPSNNSCSVATATTTTANCTAYGYQTGGSSSTVTATIVATASNAGAALRSLNTAVANTNGIAVLTATASFINASGDASVTITGTSTSSNQVGDSFCALPGGGPEKCFQFTQSVPIFLLADHANVRTLLDTATATTSWFARNNWHNLSYYAVAAAVAPGGSGACVTSNTCLQVTYHPSNGKQRAVLVLAGRALTGQDRTSSALSNWFEGANAGGVSPFELRSATLLTNRTFNDRIAVISTN